MKITRPMIAVTVLLLIAGMAAIWKANHSGVIGNSEADQLFLLVPDKIDLSDSQVTMWVDGGNEEGLHVVPIHDSTFIAPMFRSRQSAGVILPDSMHQEASDLFIDAIGKYVASGGRLMLVYDAGLKSLNGFFSGGKSRLSDLAGVNYGLYNQLRGQMIESGSVSGSISVMNELGVPPGKYYPLLPSNDAADDLDTSSNRVEIRDYKYGSVRYPCFVTSGSYNGQVLLQSPCGVAAGSHSYGKGMVLFVNLPLGYLEGSTDGLLMHGFLKFFANRMLLLPFMSPAPDAVGGLVLDWHVDSNAAIKALQEMDTWTIVDQGPFSIDITAGPDTYAFGDKQGFDVLHNPVSQRLVRKYVSLGNEIGSHGGWIHNYFSAHVETGNPKDLEQFLALNKSALEQVTGKPVVEYAAPNGDQPLWVTQWLDRHGFIAYYFTGDTGMGPTRVYRDGRRTAQNLWAFPIMHLDRAASFEDLTTEDYPQPVVAEWLDHATQFVADQRQIRLIYFHPPGILAYHDVVNDWLEQTAQLKAEDRFRWYTMAQIARFLDLREKVNWKLSEEGTEALFDASTPETLAHIAWSFPATRFEKPVVMQGSAEVLQGQGEWIVIAGDGKNIALEARMARQ